MVVVGVLYLRLYFIIIATIIIIIIIIDITFIVDIIFLFQLLLEFLSRAVYCS